MKLLRIGQAGAETAAALVDDGHQVRRTCRGGRAMICDPSVIDHQLRQCMVLEPGDLINTGTPPGVGTGPHPPVRLRPGDLMDLGIAGLSARCQHVLGPR